MTFLSNCKVHLEQYQSVTLIMIFFMFFPCLFPTWWFILNWCCDKIEVQTWLLKRVFKCLFCYVLNLLCYEFIINHVAIPETIEYQSLRNSCWWQVRNPWWSQPRNLMLCDRFFRQNRRVRKFLKICFPFFNKTCVSLCEKVNYFEKHSALHYNWYLVT